MPRYQYECPLRWGDMDSYGHVNNVAFLRLLEQARVRLLFEEAQAVGVASFEGTLFVVRHEIDYRRPLRYRAEPVMIEMWIAEIRASSFTIGYEVTDPEAAGGRYGATVGAAYASARTVLAAVDRATEQVRRLAGSERDYLEKYVEG